LIGATAGKACAATNLQSSREGTSTLGHQQFYNPNGLVGTISTNASATSYTTSSDERKKTDFRDFDSGSIIDLLKIYFFAWRKGGTGYGVKAQEAREVFPDAISEGEDGYLQADYSKFVPLLIREIQSLRARVAAIEEH